MSAKAGRSPCKPRKTGFGEVQFGRAGTLKWGDQRPRLGGVPSPAHGLYQAAPP